MTYESVDDLSAPWMGQGCELARRMLALADELADYTRWSQLGCAADLIREVVRCEYNPLPDQLPELGLPPTRRATEPGAP